METRHRIFRHDRCLAPPPWLSPSGLRSLLTAPRVFHFQHATKPRALLFREKDAAPKACVCLQFVYGSISLAFRCFSRGSPGKPGRRPKLNRLATGVVVKNPTRLSIFCPFGCFACFFCALVYYTFSPLHPIHQRGWTPGGKVVENVLQYSTKCFPRFLSTFVNFLGSCSREDFVRVRARPLTSPFSDH